MVDQSDKIETLGEKLAPPAHAAASIYLNSISNYATLFGLPAILYKLFHNVTKGSEVAVKGHSLPAAIFSTITGCGIGAYLGYKEVKQTRAYRSNLADEVIKLRVDVDANKAAVQNWSEKEQARKNEEPQPEPQAAR